MPEPKFISVVVADEATLFCEGIAAICERTPRLRVKAYAHDGVSAVKLIASMRPDVAILDLDLPKLHSAAVIRRIRRSELRTRVLVVSVQRDRKTIVESLRGGANGYILKSDTASCLLEAVDAVLNGSIYVSPQLKVTDIFTPHRPAPKRKPFDALSPREHQVFCLLVQGLRGKEIASRLDLSPKTVDTYRSSLMRKLEIYDVAGLVKFAIQNSLTSLM